MTRILIIDDERDICDIVRYNLQSAGYEADVAESAESALRLGPEKYDLLLIDVMMPGMSGFDLARHLRQEVGTQVPIIFMTARDSEDDTLQGFGLGADDYVAKPFSVRQLMARVKAVLQRAGGSAQADAKLVCFGPLRMNLADKSARMGDEALQLTRTEFQMLHFFLTHQGEVFSRQQLLERIWPSDVIVTERTVDVNITRLRKKLGPLAAHLTSRQGYGYVWKGRKGFEHT